MRGGHAASSTSSPWGAVPPEAAQRACSVQLLAFLLAACHVVSAGSAFLAPPRPS